tara:strand:+ start:4363 stop:4629 length:267 start_codon:yes stop_codon:yes gene_type:complete
MGLIKSLIKLKIYLISFAAGYMLHSCTASDERYALQRSSNKPYLVDKITDTTLPINQETFQVGNTEYRIRGLLQEKDLSEKLEAWGKK